MNISLTPELEKIVQEKVKSGLYLSASEVIRAGLRLLYEKDVIESIKIKELKKEIQKGIDSPLANWDIDGFLNSAHLRFEKNSKEMLITTGRKNLGRFRMI